MPCYRPILAYRTPSGSVVFSDLKRHGGSVESIEIACGQCVGCRLERSRRWAVRCMHEASLHDQNCFVTLTYRDAPESLDYRDFQLFMKRLRKQFSGMKVRFYMCGEYGEQFSRAHFHACLFGIDFSDKVLFKGSKEVSIYRSSILERLWPHGFCSVGDVTFESAAYVARYVMKKVTGDCADRHYSYVDMETGEVRQRTPEFNHMSLKPGIGADWLRKFSSDVYPHGKVVVNGVETQPPRYYDKIFEKMDGLKFDDMIYERYLEGVAHSQDSTEARLKVREAVAQARVNLLKRSTF